MDFKSLIKKFETNPKKTPESARFSTYKPNNKIQNKENKTELPIQSNKAKEEKGNDIISLLYSNAPDNLNSKDNIDNHRKTMTNLGNANKENNAFLSKIDMFESKKNNNKNE